MKSKLMLAVIALCIAALLKCSAHAQTCATPTATNKTFTASTVGQTVTELDGQVTAGCVKSFLAPGYNCGGCQAPLNGQLAAFNSSTGALVYKPNPGFIGTDNFTYIVRATGSNTADSAQIVVNVVVTDLKTTVTAKLTDLGVNAVSGKVALVLGQVADSPTSIIPASKSVVATLDGAGRFTVAVYPSVSLFPVSAYNLIYVNSTTGRQEHVGVYHIPASTATVDLSTCNCRELDTAQAAKLSFATRASVDALITQARSFDVQNNGVFVGTAPVINFIPGSGMSQNISVSGGIANITINCASCSGGSLASGTAGRVAYYSASNVVSDFAFSGAHKLLSANFSNNGLDWKSVACSGGISCNSTPGQLEIVGTVQAFTLNSQTGSSQTLAISNTGSASPTWNSGGNVHTLVLPFASTTATGIVNTSNQSWAGRKEFVGGVSVKAPGTLLLTDNTGLTKGFGSDYGFQHVAAVFGDEAVFSGQSPTLRVANVPNNAILGQSLVEHEFKLNNSAQASQEYAATLHKLNITSVSNLAHSEMLAGSKSYAEIHSTSGATAAQLVGAYGAVWADTGNVTDSVVFRGKGFLTSSNVTRHIDFQARDYADQGSGALTTKIGFHAEYVNVGSNRFSFYSEQGASGEAANLMSHGGALEFRGVTTANAPPSAAADNGRIYFNKSLQRFQVSANTGGFGDLVHSGTAPHITNNLAQTGSGSITLDLSYGIIEHTLNGNVTGITLTNMRDNAMYQIYWIQDASGTRQITGYGAAAGVLKCAFGSCPTGTGSVSQGANKRDLWVCFSRNTKLHCNLNQDYQ